MTRNILSLPFAQALLVVGGDIQHEEGSGLEGKATRMLNDSFSSSKKKTRV